MVARYRKLWSTRSTVVIAAVMAVTCVSNAHSDDWMAPPGWDQWLSPSDWQAAVIRGQTVEPRQTPRAESLGFLASLDPLVGDFASTAAAPKPAAELANASSPAEGSVSRQSFTTDQAPEIASVIQQSNRVKTTEFQKRSQISFDPNIRGYQGSSVYFLSDGLYWAPIRPDLDSMLNRLDPSLYENVSVISGPYGLRYGAGFAFMRILNIETPRNPDGYETRFRTGISTRTNGGQIYGRQTVIGGGTDWGYIFNYGNRVGGDYNPGGNSNLPPVPGSYASQSLLGQIGFDLTENSSLEFRFRRLDDTDTEYPLQFFDVDYMGVEAYSLKYKREDPCGRGTFSAMGWYSRSGFNGNTLPPQPDSPYYSVNRVNAALDEALNPPIPTDLSGRTFGHYMITGARFNKTYGDPDSTLLSLGADVRYMTQRIDEKFQVNTLPPFDTNLPNSQFANPGMYSELTLNWLPCMVTTIGGRVDWLHTTTDARELRPNSNLIQFVDRLDQNDVLYSFYISNELDLTHHWKLRLAGGYAQRPPSMLERYADGVFVSVAQSGLTRVIGTPTLQSEDLWQIDLSLEGQYDRVRGRIGGFYSWVDDPITYLGFPAKDPTGAYLLRYTNGNLFLRTGFEVLGEWDMNDMITFFGTARYLWGEDRNIFVQNNDFVGYRNVPLVGIYPFSGNVGIRIHDAKAGSRWGLEIAAMMVQSQGRTGFLRLGSTFVQGLDPNFESRTGGFTTFRLGGYYNVTDSLYVVGGVENILDRTYLEHLNQRLPADTINGIPFQEVSVLSPGITPYFGFEWNY